VRAENIYLYMIITHEATLLNTGKIAHFRARSYNQGKFMNHLSIFRRAEILILPLGYP
jgi:hypothetical protein